MYCLSAAGSCRGTCWHTLRIWQRERLTVMEHSQLFHARALQREAAGSFHLTVTWETLNAVRVPCDRDLKLRALSHQRASTREAALEAAAPNSFQAEREGFLPVTGLKPCLASAWGFGVAFGEGGFHHWMVYPDTGVGERELSWRAETMRRAATWRVSCVIGAGGTRERVETERITSPCKCCIKKGPLSGQSVLICELRFYLCICLCLGLFVYALSCETWQRTVVWSQLG